MKPNAVVMVALGFAVFLNVHPLHARGGPMAPDADCLFEVQDSSGLDHRLIPRREQFCRVTNKDQSPTASAEAEEDRPPGHLLTTDSLAEGKRTFYVHCTFCHGQEAGGGVGQKLTDIETVYGGGFSDMVSVITNGVRLKGMRGYLVRLGTERIAQVAAYLYSVKGTQSPSNKALRTGALFLLAPGVAIWLR